MKIQSITSYTPYGYSKNTANKNISQSQKTKNITKLPSAAYIPFFGAEKNPSNNYNCAINEILNDKQCPDF